MQNSHRRRNNSKQEYAKNALQNCVVIMFSEQQDSKSN